MIPQFGDIVRITARQDGVRWVLAPSGSFSHSDVPNVRLLRPRGDGVNLSYTITITEVTVVERPAYAVDDRVVDNRGCVGTIVALHPEHARVRWDKVRTPLKGGGYLADYDREGDKPYWQLALDNHLERSTP